jgi:endonuclease YncB( thermonuclease family)
LSTKKINILAIKIFIVSLSFIILLGCEAETKKNIPIEEKPNKISQSPTFEDEQEDVPSDSDSDNLNLKEDPIKREFSAKVIAVIDGDTIEVLENNNQIRIRLAEIDCPESTQDFGQKASLFTSELVSDKQVKVKALP